MRMLALGLGVWCFCVAGYILTRTSHAEPPKAAAMLFDLASDKSIIRLQDSDGRFFCSGVVISEKLIATAAHCIQGTETMEVRARDGKPTGIAATVVNANGRLDTALLKGDFHLFQNRQIAQDSNYIHLVLTNPNSRLIACGYPLGSELRCTPFTSVSRQDFFYKGEGYLYPGQSGGPVIDLDTGYVLGVNHAVQDRYIIINPLAEFMNDMNG